MGILNFFKNLAKPAAKNKQQVTDQLIVPKNKHRISEKDIHHNALKILHRLNEHGYEAYLVGGGVRDLLLGKHPKDFDISTSAHPEEIKKLFRNCRLIGRRFRLAHIYFRNSTIEVSTFRAQPDDNTDDHQKSESGMIIRDNVYGDIKQDAFRRDFTINALYYNAQDGSIIDFTNGLNDLKNKVVRIIGDAETRYREDPVRMLRAVRFAAKLNMQIEKSTQAPIAQLTPLLSDISPSRLFDETIKLFHGSAAEKTFELLCQHKLLAQLSPQCENSLKNGKTYIAKFITLGLQDTDKRIRAKKSVAIPFLFALFLWGSVLNRYETLKSEEESEAQAFCLACREVLREQTKHTTIPRRLQQAVYDIWILQPHLEKRRPRRVKHLVYRSRFRAAYDLLALRARAGEEVQDLAEWWYSFQTAEPQAQEHMVDALRKGKKKD